MLCVAIATANGSALVWLASAGVWRNGGPVPAADAAMLTVLVVGGGALTTGLSAGALVKRMPVPFVSRYPPQQGVAQDLATFAGLSLVLCVVPAVVASHATSAPIADSTKLVLLVLAVVAVVQAVPFVRLQWRVLDEFVEAERTYYRAVFGDHGPTLARFERIEHHFRMLIPGKAIAALIAGLWVLSSVGCRTVRRAWRDVDEARLRTPRKR